MTPSSNTNAISPFAQALLLGLPDSQAPRANTSARDGDLASPEEPDEEDVPTLRPEAKTPADGPTPVANQAGSADRGDVQLPAGADWEHDDVELERGRDELHPALALGPALRFADDLLRQSSRPCAIEELCAALSAGSEELE
jgi:hypothetical protein